MEIGKFLWSSPTVVLPERGRSIHNVKAGQFENSCGPSTAADFCVSRSTSHIASQDVRR